MTHRPTRSRLTATGAPTCAVGCRWPRGVGKATWKSSRNLAMCAALDITVFHCPDDWGFAWGNETKDIGYDTADAAARVQGSARGDRTATSDAAGVPPGSVEAVE